MLIQEELTKASVLQSKFIENLGLASSNQHMNNDSWSPSLRVSAVRRSI